MITCGFFNSVNGDRTYNAEQMNNPYKRIISNGVFAKPNGEQSDDFKVKATGTLTVQVEKGDGIFDGKWATNDSPYNIVLQVADVYNPRIDTIVFRVNYEDRIGEIVVIQGVASESPIAPDITRNDKYIDYRLANIYIGANAVAVNDTDITDTRASSECGFITHLLEQADITAIYSQWQAQFDNWLAKNNTDYETFVAGEQDKYTAWKDEQETDFCDWTTRKKSEYNEWVASNERYIAEKQDDYNEWIESKKTKYEEWFANKQNEYEAIKAEQEAEYTTWFENLKATANNAIPIQQYHSYYVTTGEAETEIPINISQYKAIGDILQVYVNGMLLVPSIDYTINQFENIVLTKPVDPGTSIFFSVIKSVEG